MLPYAAGGATWLAAFLPPDYRPQIDHVGMLRNSPAVPPSGTGAQDGGSQPATAPKHAGS
jgi:hypothetical protein